MRISVELVPRSADALCADLDIVRSFPDVDTVNVPDLMRFAVRSWDACHLAHGYMPRAVPHLRSIDFDERGCEALCSWLVERSIDEVLVVTGDPPQEMARPVFPTRPTDLIRWLKAAIPDMTVYAGLDPYRSGFRDERDYCHQKRDAGAGGFFTQPFFDLRLLDLYADLMDGETIFWGVSPVLSARSQRYWEARNRALFPRDFAPTMEWNVRFGRQALAFAHGRGTNLYTMPIKIDLREYLTGLFDPADAKIGRGAAPSGGTE
jgi:methylenetetrahydrofolate reductase (NADPH)